MNKFLFYLYLLIITPKKSLAHNGQCSLSKNKPLSDLGQLILNISAISCALSLEKPWTKPQLLQKEAMAAPSLKTSFIFFHLTDLLH